jgi:hyperosmotically inducible protein
MRRIMGTAFLAVVLLTLTGCITAYKTVVDVRDVNTIASDTKIKARIVKAYVDDESIKTLDISTYCYVGRVTLVGEYETTAQRDRAVAIARGTEGVKSVSTYMLPKKEDDPCPDLKITANIKSKLLKDQEIHGTNIDVKTVQCNVVLVGLVWTQDEIDRALEHARAAENVKGVKSFVRTPE